MALLSSPAAPVNMCQTPRPPNMSASGLYPQLSPRDALEGAVKLVEGALQSDSSYSQLVDLFGAYGPIPSTSGLHDHDYPADPLRAAAPATVPSVSMRKIPLPPELTEQVSQAQTLCRLGLFPEIGRAWLTVDSDLFLWLYETGEDLAYFDGLSEAILAVGLVAPRPGVFQRHVSALLCLATCSEIVILGVSLLQEKQQGAAEGELSLLPEPLFTVPSDGVAMTCTGGSWASGRIFFGGRDGCLYEVLYSAGGGWFGRRCRKVNHSSSVLSYLLPAFLTYPFAEEDPLVQLVVDDSRHVLYTRSEKGTLSVYDLGWPHGQGGCSRVISLPLATLSQLAARAAPTVEPDNFASLVHIEALPLSESPQAHLVAVTQAGVRLYLTTSSYASPESRPSTLALLHVRLPPGFSTHAPPQRVRGVRTAYCRRGTTLLVAAHSDERDVLWMLSADAYPFQRCLMEASTLAPLDAGVCCLAAAASRSRAPLPQCQYAVGGGATIPSDPPAVVTEHMEAPRKVVLLSRTSCCVLESPRPVDTLRGLLLDPAAVGGDAVRAFFTLHGEVQASAICLILACNPADVRLAERATQALFVYGGEAKVVAEPPPPPQQQQPSFLGAPSQVWASTPLHGGMAAGGRPSFGSPLQPVQQVGGRAPLFQGSPTAMPPPTTAAPEVLFSGRHTGCYLYFSRLVRPLWTLNLVTPVADPTTGAPTDQFVSAVPGQDLANYLQSIVAFRMFLERTSALMAGGAGTMAAAAAAQGGPNMSTRLEPDSLHLRDERLKKAQAEACSRERASLSQLLRLVSLTAELLGLWKVLCDHQFRLVSAAFPPALRDQLRSATLRELLLADRQLPAALAAALVQTYLQDNATTDAVSNRLRSVCPSLYRVEDALFTQAHEKLLAARGERGQRRRMLLDEAIALCKKVGPELPLGTACGLLVGCGHPAGVVDLCLALAQQSDPQGLAVHFYRHGEPPEDERGHRAYAARMDCYRVILQMLAELRAAPVPTSPPPLPAVEGGDQSAGGYEQVLALALQSEDELLHAALYSWLHESGQSARLLDVRSPFLEAHLQRRCCGANASPDQADLLWRYHERVGNFGAAARILARLADRQGPEVTLARRLEYLARAIVCLKGAAPTGGQVAACEGDFLHQLEEKLEVARLQAKVREALLLRRDSSASRAAELAARLDAELVDVTRLYSDYADPCDLAECKLAIVRASGYDKPLLVEGLWRSLLEREFRDSAARAEVLAQRLAMLAREYAPSERFFPLPFLVKFLELRGGQYGFEPGWILEPLLGASVPVGRLREAYSDLYRGKDPVWAGRSLHLLQALARLIRLLVEGGMRQVQGGSADRRRMANRCLDDIPGYLVDLQSMPQEEAGVAQLIREFKALQLRLEQYLQGGH